MKLNPEQDILGGWYDRDYISPFPSEDSQMSGKFNALREAGDDLTAGLAVLEQSRAFGRALSICNAAKAVHVGDLLTDQLPKVAWMGKGLGGTSLVQGLFAAVPWEGTLDPETVVKSMTMAGLSVAMTTLAAIPVYGQIAAMLVAVGSQLFSLLSAPGDESAKRILLPWSDYTRDLDEDLVSTCRDIVFRGVDWSRIFAPPFEPGFGWYRMVAEGKGVVFGPANAGGTDLAWNKDGFGVMPGTYKMAGQIQLTAPEALPEKLLRWVYDMNGNPNRLPWSAVRTICGDYFPGTVQLGAATWQQVMATGNPDMFKVESNSLERAWKGFFEDLFDSAAGQMNGAKNGPKRRADDEVSQAVEAYLCWKLKGDTEWHLGTPRGFRPAPFFHKNFWFDGPVRPEERNTCLFVEQDVRDGRRRLWPYSFKKYPAQHPDLRAILDSAGIARLPVKGEVPKGYRCVPYPTTELATAEYASPFDVFIKPQLAALRARQLKCLQQTNVSAYVRPVAIGKDLPAYAAFVGQDGKAMQTACLAAREQLLAHPIRFTVNLKDADELDPLFAKKLRTSGVTNSVSQRASASSKVSMGGKPDIPTPPPPGGGVPFGEFVTGGGGSSGGGLLAAVALLGGMYLLSR
jgi:hypothetical protein